MLHVEKPKMMDSAQNSGHIYCDTLSSKTFRQYSMQLIWGSCTNGHSRLRSSPSTAKIPSQFITVHLTAAARNGRVVPSHWIEMRLQLHALGTLCLRKEASPVPITEEAGWAPEQLWKAEKSCATARSLTLMVSQHVA
jgi:hypothetical protein